jgi:hypothetical protein
MSKASLKTKKRERRSPERGGCIRLVKPRRPTAYDRDQHDLICKALKVSNDPNAPGDTAYEAVCKVLYRQDMALAAKTRAEAKKALRIKPGAMWWIPLYGTGEA